MRSRTFLDVASAFRVGVFSASSSGSASWPVTLSPMARPSTATPSETTSGAPVSAWSCTPGSARSSTSVPRSSRQSAQKRAANALTCRRWVTGSDAAQVWTLATTRASAAGRSCRTSSPRPSGGPGRCGAARWRRGRVRGGPGFPRASPVSPRCHVLGCWSLVVVFWYLVCIFYF